MDYKIDFGPWETIFKGRLYSHEVEIVTNPEKYMLTFIYDMKDGKRIGALVEGQKALVAKGHMSSFIQTLPKRSTGIIKTNGDKTTKMLFVSFDPIYIDFKQEDFERKIDNAIKKSFENIETIIELGKTSSLDLIETSMAPETDYAPILGDPFMARSLLSGLKKTAMEMIDFSKIGGIKSETNIQLGLNKNREIIKEDTVDLKRTIILGDNNYDMQYAMHILTENFLLENFIVILFDSDNYFDGLGQSSRNDSKLKEELVDYEPAGFPIKKFETKESIKIRLDNTNPALFFELMKIKEPEIEKILSEYNEEYSTPKELLEKINEISGLNEFQKLKLERIIRIIDSKYSKIFDKTDYLKEITKRSGGTMGKASIINTKNLNQEEKIIFFNNMMKGLLKELSENKEKNIVIGIPNTEEYFNTKNNSTKEILSLENLGIGFIFGTKKELSEIKQNIVTTIQIVNERDVAVSIKNKRNYRVILRPSISLTPKKY